MKYIVMAFLCLYLNQTIIAQTNNQAPDPVIYGSFQPRLLEQAPYAAWYKPNYEKYNADPEILKRLQQIKTRGLHIQVFLGTWCGDSKREVPAFIKLLHQMQFPQQQFQLIGLGGSDSLYKQSPAGEEKGLGIFRVPTFIVYQNNTELGRINEYPIQSLEADLLKILSGQSYQPNYGSFSQLRDWLNNNILIHPNTSIRGLSQQVKNKVSNEYESNSLGQLLIKQGKPADGLKVLEMNTWLYPEAFMPNYALGNNYLLQKNYQQALLYLEKSLELNKETQYTRHILNLLYEAKEKSKSL